MDLVAGGPRVQPLRPRVADAHLPAAASPRQVRLRRRTAGAGTATRVDRVARAASCREARCAARSCAPGVRVHSYCDVAGLDPDAERDRRTGTPASGAPSSTATWSVPRGAIIGYDAAEDRRRHTVSDGGVVVVTAGEECLVDPQFAASDSPRGRSNDHHRFRFRARDPRQPRQPHRRGRGGAGGRRPGPRRRALGRLAPASARRSSCATATRSATWARACARRWRRSTTCSRPRSIGEDALDQALDRPAHDRARRHRARSKLGANAILARLPGGGQGGRRGHRAAALPLRGRRQRAHAARALHEHPERRRPRRQQASTSRSS